MNNSTYTTSRARLLGYAALITLATLTPLHAAPKQTTGVVQGVTLVGEPVKAGQMAPDFRAQLADGREFKLSELRGRTVILSIFPSINTGVCQVQTRKFNEKAAGLGEGIVVASLARNTGADFEKFCATAGIDKLLNISDLAYGEFGDKYGFRMANSQWLARGIVVVDPVGKIAYIEYTPSLGKQPNYDATLKAALASAGDDAFVLQPLPYALDALAPAISKETMSFHYGKHLAGYVKNLNKLVKGTPDAGKDLEKLVRTSKDAIFNNAGQIYNHRLYFGNFAPAAQAQKAPTGALLKGIDESWGSVEAFKAAFEKAGMSRFGSGWVWLSVKPTGELVISTTANADSPLTQGDTPIIGIDVWEHSYYLDYQNRRLDSLKAIWTILDWKKVETRYQKALASTLIKHNSK